MQLQGDVLIESVEALPEDATAIARENGRLIIAAGEATGHFHAIVDREAELLMPAVRSAEEVVLNVRFLRVMAASGVDVTHEEHATIHLPPGLYRVQQQRQYTEREIRRVAD